jgi:hypothetical protein
MPPVEKEIFSSIGQSLARKERRNSLTERESITPEMGILSVVVRFAHNRNFEWRNRPAHNIFVKTYKSDYSPAIYLRKPCDWIW